MSIPVNPKQSGPSSSVLQGKRVVLIEDESIVAIMLQRTLQRSGASIIGTCRFIEDGITLTEQKKPDLVLMDLALEEKLDGMQVVRRLSEADPGCIVLMAASMSEHDEQKLREAGASAIIRKPFRAEDLLPLLEETYRTQCASAP